MNRKLVALFLSLVMSMSTATVYAEPTNEETLQKENIENVQEDKNIQNGLVFEQNNIDIVQGQGYDVSSEEGAEYVEALSEGTIIISFKSTSQNQYQSLISIGNNRTGNQNRHFHLYITNTGAVGMELRNTDSVFKYTLSRPAALRSKYKNEYVSNTVAFKADRENHQYKLFANGELLATLDKEDFKFISDITEVNNVMLGGTNRQGTVAYPFGGTINSAQIY